MTVLKKGARVKHVRCGYPKCGKTFIVSLTSRRKYCKPHELQLKISVGKSIKRRRGKVYLRWLEGMRSAVEKGSKK